MYRINRSIIRLYLRVDEISVFAVVLCEVVDVEVVEEAVVLGVVPPVGLDRANVGQHQQQGQDHVQNGKELGKIREIRGFFKQNI